MTPSTAAGRALLAQASLMHKRWPATDGLMGKHDIIAIEAEAAAAERARLAEAVTALEIKDDFGDNWDRPVVCGHIDGPCGFRAAVLALLEPTRP